MKQSTEGCNLGNGNTLGNMNDDNGDYIISIQLAHLPNARINTSSSEKVLCVVQTVLSDGIGHSSEYSQQHQ